MLSTPAVARHRLSFSLVVMAFWGGSDATIAFEGLWHAAI